MMRRDLRTTIDKFNRDDQDRVKVVFYGTSPELSEAIKNVNGRETIVGGKTHAFIPEDKIREIKDIFYKTSN